jgi:hypothetical protein
LQTRRKLRGSAAATLFLALLLGLLILLLLDGRRLAERSKTGFPAAQAAARLDRLTDPALFTEARYARHASQADRHAAFQDHPLALEHFPAGSLMPPPPP